MSDRWTILLRDSFAAAIAAVHPSNVVARHLPPPPAGDIIVAAAGKAAAGMACAVESHYSPPTKLRGLFIAPHGTPPPNLMQTNPPRLQMLTAAHPLPDAAGARACRQLMTQVRRATKNDLVLALISGGGSSLLGAPMAGLPLAANRRIIKSLLNAGADVREINIVRSHISAALGGRLATMCKAPLIALIMSDVVGNNPADIASGPCTLNKYTCIDALAVLNRYRINIPQAILAGLTSETLATPHSRKYFATVQNTVIADAGQGLAAATTYLRQNGIKTIVNLGDCAGNTEELAVLHYKKLKLLAKQPRPAALISGGEATSEVKGNGQGGRNSEFALHLWNYLATDFADVRVLACDSDGIDGGQQVAGAVFGIAERKHAAHQKLRTNDYLQNSDSGGFFAAIQAQVCTGITGVNISDYRVCLLI